jgi:hypothetical protein
LFDVTVLLSMTLPSLADETIPTEFPRTTLWATRISALSSMRKPPVLPLAVLWSSCKLRESRTWKPECPAPRAEESRIRPDADCTARIPVFLLITARVRATLHSSAQKT